MELKKHRISVQGSSVQFPCAGDETIFAAMLRNRQGPVSYGCSGGGCGVCRMRIVSGPYEAIKNMSRAHVIEEEQQRGVVLLCCVQPRGDVVIAPVEQ